MGIRLITYGKMLTNICAINLLILSYSVPSFAQEEIIWGQWERCISDGLSSSPEGLQYRIGISKVTKEYSERYNKVPLWRFQIWNRYTYTINVRYKTSKEGVMPQHWFPKWRSFKQINSNEKRDSFPILIKDKNPKFDCIQENEKKEQQREQQQREEREQEQQRKEREEQQRKEREEQQRKEQQQREEQQRKEREEQQREEQQRKEREEQQRKEREEQQRKEQQQREEAQKPKTDSSTTSTPGNQSRGSYTAPAFPSPQEQKRREAEQRIRLQQERARALADMSAAGAKALARGLIGLGLGTSQGAGLFWGSFRIGGSPMVGFGFKKGDMYYGALAELEIRQMIWIETNIEIAFELSGQARYMYPLFLGISSLSEKKSPEFHAFEGGGELKFWLWRFGFGFFANYDLQHGYNMGPTFTVAFMGSKDKDLQLYLKATYGTNEPNNFVQISFFVYFGMAYASIVFRHYFAESRLDNSGTYGIGSGGLYVAW